MGEPQENSNQSEKEVWDYIFSPELLESFNEPYPEASTLQIEVFTTSTGNATDTITISPFYGFNTIDDLKLAIYDAKGKDKSYAPIYQFLAIPVGDTKKDTRAGKYIATDFYFKTKESPKGIPLTEPFTAARSEKIDERFVDSEGNRKILEGASRGRSLFEEIFLKPTKGKVPKLHLFLLRDVLNSIPYPKPLSELQHNGRILSYFPFTTPEDNGIDLNEANAKNTEDLYAYYKSKQEVLNNILSPLLDKYDEIVSTRIKGEKLKIKDVKYLRFVWLEKSAKKTLDTVFYDVGVNSDRPFLRYYPVDSTSVSKVHVKGVLPIPDLADPCLLLQWAKEKSPTKERDFLMGKIFIKPLFQGSANIYATIQSVDDGTGAVVIQPPKPLKKLDPTADLKLLKESIKNGIKGFPFENAHVDIDEAHMTAMIRLSEGQKKLTSADIIKRLNVFRGFFQEIPPLDGEQPLIAIRYKAVSNFYRESRVSLYLTQLVSRDPVIALTNGVQLIQEQFVLTKEEATKEFDKWKNKKDDIIPVEPEYDIYKLTYNPGIDILIYGQHPDYFFHLYRVDSYLNLQRVLTLLTMMLTIPMADLGIQEKAAKDLEKSAKNALVQEEKAPILVPPPLVPSVAPLVQSTANDGDAGDMGEFDFFDEEVVEEDAPKLDTTSLAKALATEAQVPAPAVPQPQLQEAAQKGKEEALPPASKTKISTANYFIRKLMAADSRLFDYTKGVTAVKKYVSICAANETRQPAVLDKAGYERMMLEYQGDIERREIDIITFGYEKPPVLPVSSPLKYKTEKYIEEHTFTVLKYGTDLTSQNYYLCCELFCLRDEILLRKDDFEGTKFRDNADPEFIGKTKEANRCPFCNGREIKAWPKAAEGETVFRREIKKKSDKAHTHVGFYSKMVHPERFGLPCCFTSKQDIKSSDPSFAPLHDMSKRLQKVAEVKAPENEEQQEKEEESLETESITGKTTIPNYQNTIYRAYRKYIIGAEKMPLDIGDEPQIGLLPQVLNDYFNQKIPDMVQRAQIRQELKADSKGFLRIAVENRLGRRADSFLAAVAPFIRLNTAEQVKERIRETVKPKVFLAANYGNLMLEFFDPRVPAGSVTSYLREFASKELQIKRKDNTAYITRIYRSYVNFLGSDKHPEVVSFLDDKTKVKEYRQFANLFAQPGIITQRGIVFLVLEIKDNGELEVICPPYGFTEAMKSCDIAILLHQRDIWEPIFYVNNIPATSSSDPDHIPTIRFQQSLKASWPPVLRERIDGPGGFTEQCKGPNTAVYTGIQQLKKGSKLMTLTSATKIFPELVYGIIRDTYNHIVAALFLSDSDDEESPLIAVPVLDDGIIRKEYEVYLNWDGYTPASGEIVVDFYRRNISKFAAFPGYMPQHYIIPGKEKYIKAIQLQNGIFIPVSQTAEGENLGLTPPPEGQPQVLEWTINRSIVFPHLEKSAEKPLLEIEKIESESKLEEIYQHFRLTFSNWLSGPEEASGYRHEIKQIIFPKTADLGVDLPLYEKRKRLEILLAPLVLKWIDTKGPSPTPIQVLLRKDCRSIKTKDSCSYPCTWVTTGEEGVCMIHASKKLVDSSIEIGQLFLMRLIEELIRFPVRRDQLLKEKKRHVSTLVEIKGALRIENTYILPEDSMEWSDLLRLDCQLTSSEKAKFHEEFSFGKQEETKPQQSKALVTSKVPQLLLDIMGSEDPVTNTFSLFEWDRKVIPKGEELNTILSYLGANLPGVNLTGKLGLAPLELYQIAKQIRVGIVQIDLIVADPNLQITGWTIQTNPEVFILLKTSEGLFFIVDKTKEIAPIKESSLPGKFLERVKKLNKIK